MARMQDSCLVCRSSSVVLFLEIEGKVYWRCETCEATYLGPKDHPSAHEELTQYRLHENHVDDPGYRRFLSKLAGPVLAQLAPGSEGLDYGCGPGPALAVMMREAGHDVSLYDPFFHADTATLTRTFDFITCSETAEHFHQPAEEFDRLDSLLRPGGLLGVMTCFQTDDARFANWHYRKDPTHVVFYRPATFAVLAEQRDWSCSSPVKDVVLLRKTQR
ncbi:MAG: class I SAM-dependent methyltransferase [Alphaproteobacteria bacterium]|nr:class I SAM-dependent methyltransferase [Alphaproteobacteria bacterium]